MSLEDKQYFLQLTVMDKLLYLTELAMRKDQKLIQNFGFYFSVIGDEYYMQLFPVLKKIPNIAETIDENAFLLFHLSNYHVINDNYQLLKQLFPRKNFYQVQNMLLLAKKYQAYEYGFLMIPTGTIFTEDELLNRLEIKYKLPKESIYMKFIACIIEELSALEEPIIYRGSGSYNDVFQIGNRVLKIGKTRNSILYHNSPYDVQKYLCKDFFEVNLCVQVYDVLDYHKVNEEEKQLLYDYNRDHGRYILDVTDDNFAYLLFDNCDHWNGISDLGREYLGLPEPVSEVITKGHLVQADIDYIYDSDKSPSVKKYIEHTTGIEPHAKLEYVYRQTHHR